MSNGVLVLSALFDLVRLCDVYRLWRCRSEPDRLGAGVLEPGLALSLEVLVDVEVEVEVEVEAGLERSRCTVVTSTSKSPIPLFDPELLLRECLRVQTR